MRSRITYPKCRAPPKTLPGRPASGCGPIQVATVVITFAPSLSVSRSTRKKVASWARKANCCARSLLPAQKPRVLAKSFELLTSVILKACPLSPRTRAHDRIRRIGDRDSTLRRASSDEKIADAIIFVKIVPGPTATTRILWGASAKAATEVSCFMPPLDRA